MSRGGFPTGGCLAEAAAVVARMRLHHSETSGFVSAICLYGKNSACGGGAILCSTARAEIRHLQFTLFHLHWVAVCFKHQPCFDTQHQLRVQSRRQQASLSRVLLQLCPLLQLVRNWCTALDQSEARHSFGAREETVMEMAARVEAEEITQVLLVPQVTATIAGQVRLAQKVDR